MIWKFSTLLFLIGSIVSADDKIDFNRDIRPILSGKCFACHGPDEEERGADLRLDTQDGSRADLGDYAAVVPGKPNESELIYRVTTDDDSDIMPPEGKGRPLTPKEVALLEKWIKQGGEYARHWSYEKPSLPEIPQSAHPDWSVKNPIDSFIHRTLASKGLTPSQRADRLTLARRAAIDLTGLPPSWEQAKQFLDDKHPDAYQNYIDRLLASPAFGERWAQVWLDLARYADSAGYADDPPRTIWAFRDWVIRAINSNMPFDQFTIEQIAGDLLENPTDDQLIATAFHRNTLTNNEGGTNNEEFRNVAVVDRVNTTMEVWMGTTMACAQCHTHKFDPITHEEYFQMFDYFNQSEDADKRNEAPLLNVWSPEHIERKEQWDTELATLQAQLRKDTPLIVASRKKWLESLASEPGWTRLAPTEAKGANLKITDHNSIILEGATPANATYTLKIPTKTKTEIGALRIGISPDQKSNFVVSKVSATWRPQTAQPIHGRYVRVDLKGDGKMIHLAELEIFSGGQNVALRGVASQSSTGFNGPAKYGNDGNTNGDYEKRSVTHTAIQKDPWFQIDLGKTYPIDSLAIWNRTGGNLEDRLAGYEVKILDEKKNVLWSKSPKDVPKPSTRFAMSGAIDLNFASAFATFEQNGFPASATIAPKASPKAGWAIGGGTGKAQNLILTLDRPINISEGILMIRLDQISEHKSHLLTNFQIENHRRCRHHRMGSNAGRCAFVDSKRRNRSCPDCGLLSINRPRTIRGKKADC